MKVTLEKEYKRLYTLEQLQIAKQIIKQEKEDDEFTIKEWAEYAVNEALKDENGNYTDYLKAVIEATATTAGNSRAWNKYFDGSMHMDVWIKATAKTDNGFIEIGAYLSDIWETGAVRYKQHMYIQRYKRV